MASLCTRCALRLRRVAGITTTTTTTITADAARLPRTFATSSARPAHAIPHFSPTSNAELDNVLASMRDKHFIPAALTPAQRHLIFGHSKREELTHYPRTVEIAGERIELKWIDRRTEIPNRTKLFRRALKLMADDGSSEAWRNLMQLLIGLKRCGVHVSEVEMERLLRWASQSGNFNEIIACLRRGDETGMTLKRPEVLDAVVLALRNMGQADGWSQEGIERALAAGRHVAQLLEMELHGGGKQVKPNDLRQDPRVIGVYLELSAVFADRHQGGKDADGRVKAYAERLLYNLQHAKEVSATAPRQQGPQMDILLGIAIWQGLKLAQQILAQGMPDAALAKEIMRNYEGGLKDLTDQLRRQTSDRKPGGYADQALSAWEAC